MDERRAALLRSARRAALLLKADTTREVGELHAKHRGHGIVVRLIAEAIERAFRRSTDAAANRIAEVEQAGAVSYTSDLASLLYEAADEYLAIFTDVQFWPTDREDRHVADVREDLRRCLAEIAQAAVDDLELGLAGGANVDKQKSRIINVDNRGGSGQFTFDSPGSVQTARDISTTAGSLQELATLLASLRVALREDVEEPLRTEIEDAVINLERELAEPDPSRLKRLLRGLGGFGERAAASAAGGILVKLADLAQLL